MFGEALFDLVVPRDWLGHLCPRVLIPIVSLAVSDKDAFHFDDSFDELCTLHPTMSSPTW